MHNWQPAEEKLKKENHLIYDETVISGSGSIGSKLVTLTERCE